MNISELIERLEEIKESHGDIRVGYSSYNYGYGGTKDCDDVDVFEGEMIGSEIMELYVSIS